MDTKGFVVPPGQGTMWEMDPGRSAVLKMLTRETAGSVMIFEEVAPAAADTPMHTHDASDEIAYVLSGEITFKIGDEMTVGGVGTTPGLLPSFRNPPAGAGDVRDKEAAVA
jgi:quercetin dioxygenase-like cupin family protein